MVGIEYSRVVNTLMRAKAKGKTEKNKDVYVRPAKKRGIFSGVLVTKVVIDAASELSTDSAMIILPEFELASAKHRRRGENSYPHKGEVFVIYRKEG
ncbi:hypothetical protein CVT25_005081 [Psilocybe cyanescens]|uniref:Uncharacterized protein n=1 Tax=Psilocybe cyanescens TaxID=93625 RepID=A0A409XDX5_PSICY|nr:hypothetical protein CVT25_005081 [Psilocybe cyanescens]